MTWIGFARVELLLRRSVCCVGAMNQLYSETGIGWYRVEGWTGINHTISGHALAINGNSLYLIGGKSSNPHVLWYELPTRNQCYMIFLVIV